MEIVKSLESLKPLGSGLPRSVGLHISEVISDLYFSLFPNKKFDYSDEINWTMEMGFYWERMVNDILRERASMRPPELCCDNIFMSPDGLFLTDDCAMLHELKLTFVKEDNKNPEVSDLWQWQVMSYIKGLQKYMPGLLQCQFDILYFRKYPVAPDFSHGYTSRYMLYFTQDDIDKNWNMLLEHAKANDMWEKYK